MSRCAECHGLLGGYVLAALEPDEAETVRRHLEQCPECTAELARLAGLPAMLDLAGSTERVVERPPAQLERSVLERYARERPLPDDAPSSPGRSGPRAWIRRPVLLGAGGAFAGAVLTLALLAGFGLLGAEGGERREVALVASPVAAGASGTATLENVRRDTRVRLRVAGLPRPGGPGHYELWFVGERSRVSAGTFSTGEDGRADVRLTVAAQPGRYSRIGVTREPDTSDPARNGPNVLLGRPGG